MVVDVAEVNFFALIVTETFNNLATEKEHGFNNDGSF